VLFPDPGFAEGKNTGMSHDVFISYASVNKSVADAVCAHLEAIGIRCWIAPRDVVPGIAYAESILSAIQNCRVMVLVFSSAANQSSHVLREVDRAASLNRIIVPFRIEDTRPTQAMEYYLSTPHWLDALTPPLEKHLQTLQSTLSSLLERPLPALTRPPEQKQRPLTLSRREVKIGLALVGLAAACFYAVEKGHRSKETDASNRAAQPPTTPARQGGKPQPLRQGNVSLDVWVTEEKKQTIEDSFGDDLMTIRYVAEDQSGAEMGAILIQPEVPYLKLLDQGGPIKTIGDPPYFNLSFPMLDLKMTNNSPETIFVTRVVLEVEKSRLDPTALPLVDDNPDRAGQFQIYNEGWGPIRNTSIEYRLYKYSEKPAFDGSYPFQQRLKDIESACDVDVSADLKRSGVDIETIQRLSREWSAGKYKTPASIAALNRQIRTAQGPYASDIGLVLAAGVLHYQDQKADGSWRPRETRFSVIVPITYPEAGAPAGSTGAYDVLLDVDKDNYEVTVPVSQALKRGEVDRFTLRVGAHRSSAHRFRIKLIFSDHTELVSAPVQLSLIVPRKNAEELKQKKSGAAALPAP
jgi:hypothetical protein